MITGWIRGPNPLAWTEGRRPPDADGVLHSSNESDELYNHGFSITTWSWVIITIIVHGLSRQWFTYQGASSVWLAATWYIYNSIAATNNNTGTACARYSVNVQSSAVIAHKAHRLRDRHHWRLHHRFFTAQHTALSRYGPDWTLATDTSTPQAQINATNTSWRSVALHLSCPPTPCR